MNEVSKDLNEVGLSGVRRGVTIDNVKTVSMQECVAKKMRVLLSRGMSRAEALVAATRACEKVKKDVEETDIEKAALGAAAKLAADAGRWITFHGRKIFIPAKEGAKAAGKASPKRSPKRSPINLRAKVSPTGSIDFEQRKFPIEDVVGIGVGAPIGIAAGFKIHSKMKERQRRKRKEEKERKQREKEQNSNGVKKDIEDIDDFFDIMNVDPQDRGILQKIVGKLAAGAGRWITFHGRRIFIKPAAEKIKRFVTEEVVIPMVRGAAAGGSVGGVVGGAAGAAVATSVINRKNKKDVKKDIVKGVLGSAAKLAADAGRWITIHGRKIFIPAKEGATANTSTALSTVVKRPAVQRPSKLAQQIDRVVRPFGRVGQKVREAILPSGRQMLAQQIARLKFVENQTRGRKEFAAHNIRLKRTRENLEQKLAFMDKNPTIDVKRLNRNRIVDPIVGGATIGGTGVLVGRKIARELKERKKNKEKQDSGRVKKDIDDTDLIKAKSHRLDGESLKDCIARKIRANIEEGKPREQAIAIAFSQCEQVEKSLTIIKTREEEERRIEAFDTSDFWFPMDEMLKLSTHINNTMLLKHIHVNPDASMEVKYYQLGPTPVEFEEVPNVSKATELLDESEGRWVTINGRRVFIRAKISGPEADVQKALKTLGKLPDAFRKNIDSIDVHRGPALSAIPRGAFTGAALGAYLAIPLAGIGGFLLKVPIGSTSSGGSMGVMLRGAGIGAIAGAITGLPMAFGLYGAYFPFTKAMDLYPYNTRSWIGRKLGANNNTYNDVINHESAHSLFWTFTSNLKSAKGRDEIKLMNNFIDAATKEQGVTPYAQSYYQLSAKFLPKSLSREVNRVFATEDFAEMHMNYRRRDRTPAEWNKMSTENPETTKAFNDFLKFHKAL